MATAEVSVGGRHWYLTGIREFTYATEMSIYAAERALPGTYAFKWQRVCTITGRTLESVEFRLWSPHPLDSKIGWRAEVRWTPTPPVIGRNIGAIGVAYHQHGETARFEALRKLARKLINLAEEQKDGGSTAVRK